MLYFDLTVYGDGQCDIDMGSGSKSLHGTFMAPAKSRALMGIDMQN